MASLAGILRFMGGIPGRMREAQYEHEPVYRERRERLDLGDDLGEADFPTGDLEPAGEKRTGRLSKFGKFTKEALPQILRGALVAAANPTPGKVGTAADIFGAIGAVGEDKQNRDMLAYKIQRQLEQDNMDRRLNDAKARDYEAQADYNQWRTQQAVTGKQGKPIPPSKLEMYKEAYKYYKNELGYSDEDAHVEARSIALGTMSPELYNKRTASTDQAQMNRELEKYRNSPELQQQYPTFEEYYKSLGIGKAKASTAEEVARSTAKGKLDYRVPDILKDAGGYFQSSVSLGPDGKPTRSASPLRDNTGRQLTPPKPSGGKPPRARYRFETDKDGVQWRINVDNPAEKVKTGVEKKVSGGESQDLRERLIQSLTGGKSTKEQPKIFVGQTVKLKNGQTVTVKKVNPDGTFEY